MIRVKQTKLHSETQKGNCLAAALASLFELPLNKIPEFEEMGDSWSCNFITWLYTMGYEHTCIYDGLAPKGYALASGISDRGVNHMVIVKDGVFVHDPHPSNTFIKSIDAYWVIRPRPYNGR